MHVRQTSKFAFEKIINVRKGLAVQRGENVTGSNNSRSMQNLNSHWPRLFTKITLLKVQTKHCFRLNENRVIDSWSISYITLSEKRSLS